MTDNIESSNLWFTSFRDSTYFRTLQDKPLAYFCIEYALSDDLYTFAGGLGILARDYVKELSDQQIPAVAIGLMYHKPYGTSEESSRKVLMVSQNKNLSSVLDKNGSPLLLSIPIQDHKVFAKVWLWNEGTVRVFLLDTNVTENTTDDRGITRQLYASNKETRLKQEIILGIGGFRLLDYLGIDPSVIHMNEGHSSLLGLEFIRLAMQKKHLGFTEAVNYSCRHVVFTNHTMVPAGNEIFSNDLFSYLLEMYASEFAVPINEILSLGAVADTMSFSMTNFAMRIAGSNNAVSKMHAKKASEMWNDYQFSYVTNGIHLQSWDGVKDGSLTKMHSKNKVMLIDSIAKKTGYRFDENALLLGWARRIVPYKRPLALFEMISQLKAMVHDSAMPIRIVMSGIAPPGYGDSLELLHVIRNIIDKELTGCAVYLPEYDSKLAYDLVTGCDVWLNTPVVGSEACGTSGMKACLNGNLPISTKDGWVDEIDMTDIGWLLDNDTITESIIEKLRESILPEYYQNNVKWNSRMLLSRKFIQHMFSTTRMLKDYFEKIYIPMLSGEA